MLTRPDDSDFTRFSEGMTKKNELTQTGHGMMKTDDIHPPKTGISVESVDNNEEVLSSA